MNNIAIIVTGTICSGKTTLAKRISEDVNYRLLNEENIKPFNFENVCKQLQMYKLKNIIVEHTDILNYFNEIIKFYKTIILIYLDVSDEILLQNLSIRKNNKAVGDFSSIDYITLKKNIEEKVKALKNEVIYFNVLESFDYDREYAKLIHVIKEKIKTAQL